MTERKKQANILITGTSSGLGLESAILFAEHGYKVYATMRNLNKSKAIKDRITDKMSIKIKQLDVTSSNAVNNVVHDIIEEDGAIDILLNNAGAGFAKTLEQTSEEEIDWMMDVNFKGAVRTTKAVLPYMRKKKAGHIINISSVGGLVGQPFNELYCASKFALEGFTESLASYLSIPFNIHFSLIEPGGMRSEFMNTAVTKTINSDGAFATGEYTPIFTQYFEGNKKRADSDEGRTYQSGRDVAKVILQVVESDRPPLRIRTSDWGEKLCHIKTDADPDGLKLLDYVNNYFLNV